MGRRSIRSSRACVASHRNECQKPEVPSGFDPRPLGSAWGRNAPSASEDKLLESTIDLAWGHDRVADGFEIDFADDFPCSRQPKFRSFLARMEFDCSC